MTLDLTDDEYGTIVTALYALVRKGAVSRPKKSAARKAKRAEDLLARLSVEER